MAKATNQPSIVSMARNMAKAMRAMERQLTKQGAQIEKLGERLVIAKEEKTEAIRAIKERFAAKKAEKATGKKVTKKPAKKAAAKKASKKVAKPAKKAAAKKPAKKPAKKAAAKKPAKKLEVVKLMKTVKTGDGFIDAAIDRKKANKKPVAKKPASKAEAAKAKARAKAKEARAKEGAAKAKPTAKKPKLAEAKTIKSGAIARKSPAQVSAKNSTDALLQEFGFTS